MSDASYYFLPSARHGLAGAIKNASITKRATVDVILNVSAQNKSTGELDSPARDIPQTVELYGPGDILGFHQRVIARHDPKSDVGDFEPNYFPAIEFTDPDFIWRFTANKADVKGLTPWLTLIVLISESRGDDIVPEFEEGPRHNRNLPPSITVIGQNALPDLQNSWRWAHVQAFDEMGNSNNELIEILTDEPERAICRLMCPRRLRPQTRYDAFVVPSFKLGVHAGLGEDFPEDVDALALSWAYGENNVRLPYYYRWQFRTGMRGDFEHLVRLLEPRQLTGLGLRAMDCSAPGFGVSGVEWINNDNETIQTLEAEGALESLDTRYTPWGKDSHYLPGNVPNDTQVDIADLISLSDFDREMSEIASILNNTAQIHNITIDVDPFETPITISWQAENSSASRLEYWIEGENIHSNDAIKSNDDYEVILEDIIPTKTYHFKIVATLNDNTEVETPESVFEIPLPIVTPPIYGRWHYGRTKPTTNTTIDPDNQAAWIDHLNLDPRHRVAAGLGSQVIRKQQEPLMASAWDQLGAIENANDLLRRSQFARDCSNFLHFRFDNMQIEDYLRITNPVQKRVIIDDPTMVSKVTVAEYFNKQSRIPEALFDPALRRIMRPRGPIRKKKQHAGKSTNLLNRLATAQFEITPAPPKPAGTSSICTVTQGLEDALSPIEEPTLSLAANPVSVNNGDFSTLTWSSSNTTSCVASGFWSGPKPTAGSEVVGPFGADVGTIPGNLTSPGGALAGYIVEAWAEVSRTGSTNRIPRTLLLKLARASTTSLGEFVINIDEQVLNRLKSKVHFRIYNPIGRLIANTTNTLNWDTANPGSVDINLDSVLDDGTSPGGPDPGPVLPVPYGFSLTCTGPGGDITANATVYLSSNGTGGGVGTTVPSDVTITPRITSEIVGTRFCEGQFDCDDMGELPDIPDAAAIGQSVCSTLENWLDVEPVDHLKPPIQDNNFLGNIRDTIHTKIDPEKTLVERSEKRLKLSGALSERFDETYQGDPLDSIMWSPEFPQPMYEPLRDISHDLLLPGVEKIPQNTIGLLQTNRRFLESYMCSCNHEFASELLWRGYPTDQRGSYFRQFWDVEEHIPQQAFLDELFTEWKQKQNNGAGLNNIDDIPREFREQRILHDDRIELAVPILTNNQLNTLTVAIANTTLNIAQLISAENKRRLVINNNDIKRVLKILNNNQLNELFEEIVTLQELEEWLRDIKPMIKWGDSSLGSNKTKDTTMLVLVVRGDLLKRYPNALIYAIDAVHADGDSGTTVPALPEFIKPGDSVYTIEDIIGDSKKEFPVFKATLPTDLTFFGFAFDKTEAIEGGQGLGKMFVIEEMVTDARFGMDLPTDPAPQLDQWDDLSWAHLGFGVDEDNQHFGVYVDNAPDSSTVQNHNDPESRIWNDNQSSATRAWITFQKPVRIALHANQMIPDEVQNI